MKKTAVRTITLVVLMSLLFVQILPAVELRVRNVARFKGIRDNQVTGFGLVVGLKGTGDRKTTVFTGQAIANMLKRFGIADGAGEISVRNVAAVMVTANLPAFAKKGDKLDVVVSSMGDAKSLDGGVLLQTVLKGIDENTYATAQGALSTGGGETSVSGVMSVRTRQTVGRVPQGALVEREVPVTFVDDKYNMYLQLQTPDFTTASRITETINKQFWSAPPNNEVANAVDANTIRIRVPFDFQNNTVEFIAAVEGLYVEIEERSEKLVINERTGTVVMGADIAIDTCAIAHGNFNVKINVTKQVSQPNPFAPGASALLYNDSSVKVEGGGNQLVTMPQGASVIDLVNALNVLGASPQDIISIIQAIKAAGALHGEIEIM